MFLCTLAPFIPQCKDIPIDEYMCVVGFYIMLLVLWYVSRMYPAPTFFSFSLFLAGIGSTDPENHKRIKSECKKGNNQGMWGVEDATTIGDNIVSPLALTMIFCGDHLKDLKAEILYTYMCLKYCYIFMFIHFQLRLDPVVSLKLIFPPLPHFSLFYLFCVCKISYFFPQFQI